MKSRAIIYPFIFCLYPILFLYAQNIDEVGFSEVLLPAAVMLGFTLVSLLLLNIFLRNINKTALIVTIFLVLFYSYGHVLKGLDGRDIKFLSYPDWLLILWSVLFLAGVYFVLRTRRDPAHFTRLLSVIIFILMGISIINIAVYQIKEIHFPDNNYVYTASADNNKVIQKDSSGLRDIYYIILDGYAGSETLKELYGFDNNEFNDYLEKKGFYLASKSLSNYGVTFLSLASSLNMEYLNDVCAGLNAKSKNRSKIYSMIRENEVVSILKQKGYKYIHFDSGWGGTKFNKFADLNIHGSWYSEYMMVLIKTTALTYFNDYFAKNKSRTRILGIFKKIPEIQNKIKGPKFVFAHITCPHPPYLFNADGGMVDSVTLEMDGREWGKKGLYLDQVKYLNKLTEELVDNLLARSESEPVIILQADHGSASSGRPHPPLNLTNEKTINKLRERMSIFNAYFLPGGGSASLYPSITPVNSFRVIFNFYFGGDSPLLEDRCYYGDYDTPYVLTDVTGVVSTKK